MRSASGDLIPPSCVLPIIAGVTIAVVALTLYCFSHGISTVFMHLYYLPIILIAYYYRRRGIPVFTALSVFYLAVATFFLYPSMIDIESAVIRAGMFILIGVIVAELSERLERQKEEHRIAGEDQKSIIDNANVWLTILDPKGKILVWNRAAETISGYRADEVMGQTGIWKLLYPDKDYRKKITGTITRIIAEKNYFENFESEIRTKDGSTRTISWNTRGLIGAGGSVERYVAIGLDITGRKRAEQKVAEYSRFLTTLIDTLPVPLFYKDIHGKYLGCNPPFEEYIGVSRSELVGKTAYDIAPKDLADRYEAADRAVFDNPAPQKYETQIRFADGSRHDVIFYKAPFYNNDGSLGGLIGTFLDITERKQMEAALHESEERYRTVIENASEAIVVAQDGVFKFANPKTMELLQTTPEKIIGHPFIDFIHPDDRELVAERYQRRVMGENVPVNYDFRFVGENGRIVWVIISAVRIQWEGRPATLNFLIEITERKRIEEALHNSQQILRSVLDTIPVRVFWKDHDLKYLGCNAPFAQDAGFHEPEELIGKDDYQMGWREQAELYRADDRMVIETGKSKILIEEPQTTPDGRTIWLLTSKTPLQNSSGEITGVLGVYVDITERKRMEDALRQANKQLNLLSSITRHDILNQLMALKGYLYLSKEMIDKPAILAGYIQKEEQAANAIEHQIKFTKDYHELGVAAPEWQYVNASIMKAVTGLPMRDIHIEVDPHDPKVFADRLFEKVFYNLIDNALRYGGSGMKTIRFSSHEIDTALLIVCEDDGVGISADDKKKLFTRGFGKNTGLGLFLSREILAITSITITENGVPGKGARFEITVPKGAYRFTSIGNKK